MGGYCYNLISKGVKSTWNIQVGWNNKDLVQRNYHRGKISHFISVGSQIPIIIWCISIKKKTSCQIIWTTFSIIWSFMLWKGNDIYVWRIKLLSSINVKACLYFIDMNQIINGNWETKYKNGNFSSVVISLN